MSRSAPVGTKLAIVPPDADYLTRLDDDEYHEQIRDWAVVGTLQRLGIELESVSPRPTTVARVPELEGDEAFEYGPSRMARSSTRLLFFLDSDDPDPVATLGRLADRAALNKELPSSVEVYSVSDAPDIGEIQVERRPDISRETLFSAEYGYVAVEASTEARLVDFLTRTDDLVRAEVTSDHRLLLAGRRFTNSRATNIALEDVASLAASVNPDLEFSFRAAPPNIPPRPLWLVSPRESARSGIAVRPRDQHESLDLRGPLTRHVSALAEDPCGTVATIARRAAELEAREPDSTKRTALANAAIAVRDAMQAPSLPACGALDTSSSELLRVAAQYEHENEVSQLPFELEDGSVARAVRYYLLEDSARCRKQSELSGTSVEMTLLYTQLAAIAWTSDHDRTAPIEVPGFPIQEHDGAAAEGLDVHFEPGTNVSHTDSVIGFEHVFVTLDAAHNAPGTAPKTERTIRWWRNHFEAIASYEPEFHRLNQIEKWATVVKTFGDAVPKSVRVHARHDHAFDAWRERNADRLRFQGSRIGNPVDNERCLPVTAATAVHAVRAARRMPERRIERERFERPRETENDRKAVTERQNDVRNNPVRLDRPAAPALTRSFVLSEPRPIRQPARVEAAFRVRAAALERSPTFRASLDRQSPNRVTLSWAQAAKPTVGGGVDRKLGPAVDPLRRRPSEFLTYLPKLARGPPTVDVKERLASIAAHLAAPSAKRQIDRRLAGENVDLSALRTHRGRVVLTRDISAASITRQAELPKHIDKPIYFDDSLRLGREGLATDVGGVLSRIHRAPDLRIEVATMSPSVDVAVETPDEIVVPANVTFSRLGTDDSQPTAHTVLLVCRCKAGYRQKVSCVHACN